MNEILDVARIDHGVLRLAMEPFDAVALIEDVASVMATPEQPIEIRVQSVRR